MDSPLPTVALVVAYLYVVMFLGPRMMANRKPFKLNEILVIYNAIQVIFSLLMLWEVCIGIYLSSIVEAYTFRCNRYQAIFLRRINARRDRTASSNFLSTRTSAIRDERKIRRVFR